MLGRLCHITYFEFMDVNIPEYEAGQEIKLRIKVSLKKICRDVIGRLVFRSIDGEVFAMTESNVVKEVQGNVFLNFKFISKNIPKGTYSLVVSLNEINEFGEYEMLDEIPEMIPFRILENNICGKYKSAWIDKYWGKIRLDEMNVDVQNWD